MSIWFGSVCCEPNVDIASGRLRMIESVQNISAVNTQSKIPLTFSLPEKPVYGYDRAVFERSIR